MRHYTVTSTMRLLEKPNMVMFPRILRMFCYRSFGFAVPMTLVVGFMGNAMKSFQEPLASVLVPFSLDDRF